MNINKYSLKMNTLYKVLKENDLIYDPRKIIASGQKAIKNVVKEKTKLFKNN